MKRFMAFFVILLLACAMIPAMAAGDLSGTEIVERMAETIPEITDIASYLEQGDPDGLLGQPGSYLDKITWMDQRVGELCTLEIYASAETAGQAAGEDIQLEDYVLRLSDKLSATEVEAYRAALSDIAGISEKENAAEYILNTNTKKFHWPSCSSVKTIKDSNKQVYNGDREDLIDQGYEPCKRCDP